MRPPTFSSYTADELPIIFIDNFKLYIVTRNMNSAAQVSLIKVMLQESVKTILTNHTLIAIDAADIVEKIKD